MTNQERPLRNVYRLESLGIFPEGKRLLWPMTALKSHWLILAAAQQLAKSTQVNSLVCQNQHK